MTGLVLSSSSVSAWLDCHLQWWFRYVLQAEGESSEALDTGIAVHAHIEEYLKSRTLAGRDEPMVFIDRIDVVSLFVVWEREVRPLIGRPRFVEEQYRFNINGIDYQSTLDLVDEDGVVIDTKTTRSRPRPGRYRIPLIGHALGYRALTGEKERGRRLDYLVRTKTPYYWPEAIEGPATIDEIVEFGATVEAVAEGIAREDYAATGLDSPWACASCPYRNECGPRLRYEGEHSGR